MRTELAGRDLSQYMIKLLTEHDNSFSSLADFQIASDIKEKVCYVAEDFDQAMKASGDSSTKDVTYSLPDGKALTIGNLQFRCPEALFQPHKLGKECPSFHELAYKSIMKCDVEFRRELFENIVLSGGNTIFKDFPERFQKEVTAIAPNTIKVRVISPEERKVSAWVGGSILSSLSSFQVNWITKDEYDDVGPTIIHRKCF